MEREPDNHTSVGGNGDEPAYVTLILDETGSMLDCKGAAIAGFNEYLKTLRKMPTTVRFTLTLFNSKKTEVRHHVLPVVDVPDLTDATYQPADGTPLYDAIGRTLTIAGQEVTQVAKKLCVILTDGLENASREYTKDGIAHMIKEYESRGWMFVYLGADHDAWAAGGDLGISGNNTVQFSRRDTGQLFGRLGGATVSFLLDSDRTKSGFWTDASQQAEDHDGPGTSNGSAT